jgi:hypothetical protein
VKTRICQAVGIVLLCVFAGCSGSEEKSSTEPQQKTLNIPLTWTCIPAAQKTKAAADANEDSLTHTGQPTGDIRLPLPVIAPAETAPEAQPAQAVAMELAYQAALNASNQSENNGNVISLAGPKLVRPMLFNIDAPERAVSALPAPQVAAYAPPRAARSDSASNWGSDEGVVVYGRAVTFKSDRPMRDAAPAREVHYSEEREPVREVRAELPAPHIAEAPREVLVSTEVRPAAPAPQVTRVFEYRTSTDRSYCAPSG